MRGKGERREALNLAKRWKRKIGLRGSTFFFLFQEEAERLSHHRRCPVTQAASLTLPRLRLRREESLIAALERGETRGFRCCPLPRPRMWYQRREGESSPLHLLPTDAAPGRKGTRKKREKTRKETHTEFHQEAKLRCKSCAATILSPLRGMGKGTGGSNF